MHAGSQNKLSNTMQGRDPGSLPQSVLGSLIVNSKGEVSFCSDSVAEFAGYTRDELVGSRVRHFIPALPMNPDTEGYNIAFGVFSSNRRRRQSWMLKKRDGGTVKADAYFGMLKMDSGYVFCLELHEPAAGGNASNHWDS